MLTKRTALTTRAVKNTALLLLMFMVSLNATAAMRKFEFKTTEVTQPFLSVAADGQSLVFHLAGHLFRVSVGGGSAQQITFGPHYDHTPVLSPDGKRLAFISSRDGSDGNLFVMELANGKMTQLTSDFQVSSPSWSPDGKTIAYMLMLDRHEYPVGRTPGFSRGDNTVLSKLSTVSTQGTVKENKPKRLSDLLALKAVAYLPDGRILTTLKAANETTVEARTADGKVSALGALPRDADRIVLSPKGDGIYYFSGGKLNLFNVQDAKSSVIGAYTGNDVRMDIARDGKTLYTSSDAKLWRVDLTTGAQQQIPFAATVAMEALVPAVKRWAPRANPEQPRVIMTPRLSPDGKTLVFAAAGSLWIQSLASGEAKKLVDEPASYQIDPAFSPDGKQLAFGSDIQGRRELRVYDFASGKTQTLVTVPRTAWATQPGWSSDSQTIVYQQSDALFAPYKFMRVAVQSPSAPQQLGQSLNMWNARPHLAPNEHAVYYTEKTGLMANLYKLPITKDAKPEAVTDLGRHVHDGLVSPDGKWLAFRRNSEIWVASRSAGAGALKDSAFRRLSRIGGRSFAFTADSSELVYAEGAKVYRQAVASGAAKEIPVRIKLPQAQVKPVLVQNVRVLDLGAGRFTQETSMLLEGGRISWIGPEAGHVIPNNVTRIDAAGKFAMPGIMESHAHSAWANHQVTDESFIAYGVTSVRDTGSRVDVLNSRLDRGDSENDAVPRYFHSGDIFEGYMPLWGDAFLEITTKEEARDYVKHWKNLGADFVKIYDSLPWSLRTVVAEEANRQGLPVAGHGLNVEQFVRSVNLGFTTVEHNQNNNNDDMVKLFASSGLWVGPTLNVFGSGTGYMLSDVANLDQKFVTYIPEGLSSKGQPVKEETFNAWKKNTLGKIHEKFMSGVRMLDGTDALMGGVFHGPSVHWSLQFFSWAGIPAIDVLRMGTIKAAESVGADAQLGSLEQGKIADVILLDANPLENVANTMKIWRVVKGGNVYDPATLRVSKPDTAQMVEPAQADAIVVARIDNHEHSD